jgi:hypothetical protein
MQELELELCPGAMRRPAGAFRWGAVEAEHGPPSSAPPCAAPAGWPSPRACTAAITSASALINHINVTGRNRMPNARDYSGDFDLFTRDMGPAERRRVRVRTGMTSAAISRPVHGGPDAENSFTADAPARARYSVRQDRQHRRGLPLRARDTARSVSGPTLPGDTFAAGRPAAVSPADGHGMILIDGRVGSRGRDISCCLGRRRPLKDSGRTER